MPFSDSSAIIARTRKVPNGYDSEYDNADMKNGPSIDEYDDFPLGMGNGASRGGSGGARNKNKQQQIYSSKHTRLRENRISSSKAVSPKR